MLLQPLKKIRYLPENIIDSVIVTRTNANNDGIAGSPRLFNPTEDNTCQDRRLAGARRSPKKG